MKLYGSFIYQLTISSHNLPFILLPSHLSSHNHISGQTGSGKTYTMNGPSHDRGVNERALGLVYWWLGVEIWLMDDFLFFMSILSISNQSFIHVKINKDQSFLFKIIQYKYLDELFNKSNERKQEIDDLISISILEIYNDQIRFFHYLFWW